MGKGPSSAIHVARQQYADYTHLMIRTGRKRVPLKRGTNSHVSGIDRRAVENAAEDLREALALGMSLAQYRAEGG